MITVKDGKIVSVKPPLEPKDAEIISVFKVSWGTVIYVPFDPRTNTIPQAVLNDYPEKRYGNVIVRYSPNLHRIMLNYYTHYDPQRGQYITKIPVLLVDYGTVKEATYAGKQRPPARSIAQQLKDWRSGTMYGRSLINKDVSVTYCAGQSRTIGCIPKRLTIPAGYWWVGYMARFLELPTGILVAERDVVKFHYRRPKGVVFKIPGFSSVADYVYKRKIKGQYKQLEQLLNAFGLVLDGEPWVEETNDGYVVNMPVRRAGKLALPAIPIWLVGLIVISVTLIVSLHYISSIESTRAQNYRLYLQFLSQAQDELTECTQSCNGNEECINACQQAYASAVNSAEEAFKNTNAGIGDTFEEMTELIKWAVVAMVVVQVIGALGAMRR